MLLGRFIVAGESMEPAFSPGDKLIVSSLIYKLRKPQVGDVVIVTDPRDGRSMLKRIGEIKADRYLVVGDNEKLSTDSRVFGPVTKKAILAKVIWCYKRSN